MGTFGYVIFAIDKYVSLFDSKRFFIELGSLGYDLEVVSGSNPNIYQTTITFLLAGVFFDNLAALLVILSWLATIKDLSTFFPDLLSRRERQFTVTFKIIFVIGTLLLISTFIFSSLVVAVYMINVYMFVCLALYSYMAYIINSKYAELFSQFNSEVLKRARNLIKQSFKVYFTLIVITSIFQGLASFTLKYSIRNTQPGNFCLSINARYFGFLIALIQSSYGFYYVHSVSHRIIRHSMEKSTST